VNPLAQTGSSRSTQVFNKYTDDVQVAAQANSSIVLLRPNSAPDSTIVSYDTGTVFSNPINTTVASGKLLTLHATGVRNPLCIYVLPFDKVTHVP
jgi:hypothetical protein